MKNFRRILASLMVAIMLVTAAPLSGFVGLEVNLDWLNFTTKASAATYNGTCGDNLTWSLDTSTGELVISGTGDMYDYDYDAPWYDYIDYIDSVMIADGVTSIGSDAFRDCIGLTSIAIPDSVTSIGGYAFFDCISIRRVTIPDGVTSIGVGAFSGSYGDYEKDYICIPDSVTYIGEDAFRVRDNATVIVGRGVKDLSWLLTPGCDICEIKKFYYSGTLEEWCESNKLTWLSIEELYINGSEMLEGDIVIPDGITEIDAGIFSGIVAITSVTIPDSVTSIGGYSFNGCTGLTSVNIGNGVTSIGYSVFDGCSGIKELTMPISAKIYNSSYDHSFIGCTNIEKITLTRGNGTVQSYTTSTSTSATDTYYQYTPWYISDCPEIVIEEGVTAIGSYTFYNCSNLDFIHYLGDSSQFTWGSNALSGTSAEIHDCIAVSTSPLVCTQEGMGNWYCEECDEIVVENVAISALGHDWSNKDGVCARENCGLVCEHPEDTVTWETVVEPTCVPGLKRGLCGVCGMSGDETTICDSSTYPESPHSYSNNYNKTWTFSYPGAYKLILKFSTSTETESNYDYIYIYNSAGTQVGKYSGTQLSGKEIEIEGSSFKIKLTSDGSKTKYGFKFDYIEAVVEGNPIVREIPSVSDHDWSNKDGVCANGCGTTCSHESFTDGECDVCGTTCSVIGHDFGDWQETTAPTCTETGVETKYCSHCDVTETRVVNYLGHDIDADSGKCTVCGNNCGTCGTSLIWTLDDSGRLTISGTGAMSNYSDASSVPWYTLRPFITSVVIGDGVTSVGNYAFYRCGAISELTMPISAKIYNSSYTFGGCNSIEKITLTKGDGTVQSYSSSTGYSNTYYGYTPWYLSGNILKEIAIEDGVTGIGYCTFYGCTGITSITIPDSVTSIGEYVFEDCTSLTSVTIGNSVTSIGYSAFYGCTGLENVYYTGDITEWCTISFGSSSSNPMYYADNLYFDGELVTELVIPDSVTSIGEYAFYGCTGLTSITIPDSVTSIGYDAFYYCTGLENVYYTGDVTKWCTISFSISSSNPMYYANNIYIDGELVTELVIPDSVTSIGEYAFYGCTGLTSVTIPDSVTSISSSVFRGCTGLTSVTIPDSVTSIGSCAFDGCTGLTSVTIPDSVTSIGSFAFDGCTGLTSVTIPDSVTSIGYSAFYGCTGLTSITIPDSVTSIGHSAFEGCTGLTSVTIGNGVTSFGYSAFEGCTGLTSVTIGNGVTSIGEHAFEGCTGLTSVIIGNSVTSIGFCAFKNCTGLTNIAIPDSVISIGSCAFEGCTGLTSVTIGNGVTSISSYAFFGCTGLTSVTIGNSVTSIGQDAFDGCTGLTSITIPDSVTSIGEYAFEGCTGLTSVTIGNGVKTIDGYAFYGCSGIKELTMPISTKIYNSSYTFGGCANIEKITLTKGNGTAQTYGISTSSSSSYTYYGYTPWYRSRNKCTEIIIEDGVTSIGSYTFNGCTGLKSVTIPDSVTSIGSCAFYGCSGIQTTYYSGTKAQWNNISIGSDNSALTKCVVYNCNSERPYYDSGTCGANVEWILYTDGELVISGTGAMTNWSSSSSVPWYSCSRSIKSVVISDDITSIGSYAFYNCTGLTSVTIPDSVTSIGEYAFYGCTGLTSVTIGNGVTSIDSSAFAGCSGLVSFTVSNDNPNFSTDEHGVLFNKDKTTLIQYPAGNDRTSYTIHDSVTSIGSFAFVGCSGLVSFTVSNDNPNFSTDEHGVLFNKDKTTLVQYPAGNDRTSYTIPDSVTNIGQFAFYGCSGIKELTMPISAKIYNNSYGHSFVGCTNIEKITLSKGNGTAQSYSSSTGYSDTYYQYTPWYISGCPEIVIAEGVTSIGSYTFYNCTNLVSIHYLGNRDQLTWVSNSFDGTSATVHYCTKTITSNATCTLDGAYDWYCESCDKNFAENIVIPALGHDLGEWQVTTAPTCTETGVETKFCSRCDVTETRVVEALGHDWSNKDGVCARENCGLECEHPEDAVTWETVVEPTCVPGLEHGYCNICGMQGEKTIICDSSTYPESPHDYYNSCNETWTFSYTGANKLILKFSNSTQTESNCDSIYIYNSAGVLIGQYSGTELSGKEIEIEGSSFQIRLTSDSSVTRYGFKFDYIKAVISVGALEAIIPAVSDHDWSNKDGICAYGCGTECAHETFTDGECDVCGATCLTIGHIYDDIAGECVICGHNCENMGHIFNSDNTECVVCGLVTGTCGDSLTWTLDRNGKLVITGTGPMIESFDETSLYTWHRAGVAERIVTVIISDGVTSIGSYAFYCCTELTSITIPDSVTSIGDWAFAECLSLTEITIPDSVTSIGDYAFVECLGLTNVTIGAGVESIGDFAFVYCISLKDVIFLGEDEISLGKYLFITAIEDELDDYYAEIPGLMICCKENSWMHYYVDSNDKNYCLLDSENNPAFEIQGDSLASYRGNASNVVLPSVSKIGYGAFANNSTIETVEIPKGVSRIYNNAFKNCSALKSVYIPQSVTSIGATAFSGCEDVTIWCYPGSYADEYAQSHDINVEYITLSIDQSIIYIAPNEQTTVTYSLSTHISENMSVVWESTDKTIVTVDSFGNIKGVKAGTAVIVLTSKDGTMRDYCVVKVVGIEAMSTLNIDFESGIISGLSSNTASLEGLITMTDTSCNLNYTTLGTDSIVYVERDNEIVDAYTIVIFGDVNGDGWYDGTDSIIVSCLANGLLTKDNVSEAVYMAADCNHDGTIDALDVALLEQAGALLASVDQSKSNDELATDAAYIEYLDLIDQTPDVDDELPEQEDVDEEGSADADTSEQGTEAMSVIEMIIKFIKSILEMLLSFIPVPYK